MNIPMKKLLGGTETKIVHYVEEVFQPEDHILREARERADRNGLPHIQVGKMDGLHLEVLTRISGAKKAVEIGTLGGYSGICIARGLTQDGKLYTFEFEPLHAEVAQENFKKAGLSDKVEIFVGPALQNLPKIQNHGPFDLVFLDADKVNYPEYMRWAADNLRIGGLMIADNTFAWGTIADDHFESPEDAQSVRALREFNSSAAQGGRFRSTLLPTGEGLTVGVKIN